MDKQKAFKIIESYKRNNYNGYKTLIDCGYKETTARKKSKDTIEVATKVYLSALASEVGSPTQSSEVSTRSNVGSILDRVGITSEDLLSEFKSVVMQNRDLTNKLKAMSPLLKELSINLDNSESTQSIPTLNVSITPKAPHSKDTPPIKEGKII